MRALAGFGRRLAAFGLAVSLSGVPLCLGQTAGAAGTLTGRVFASDGATPRAGVVVKAANLTTSKVYASTRTDPAGRYSLATLPAGQYQVAVESREGLYVNADRIPVLQGRKTLFSMALNPRTADDEPPEKPPEEPAQAEPEEPAPPAEQPAEEAKPEEKGKEKGKKKEKTPAEQEAAEQGKEKGAGFWRSGWGVAVGLGGGAIVLGLLADSIAGDTDEVEPVSQSTP